MKPRTDYKLMITVDDHIIDPTDHINIQPRSLSSLAHNKNKHTRQKATSGGRDDSVIYQRHLVIWLRCGVSGGPGFPCLRPPEMTTECRKMNVSGVFLRGDES